jgi:hypothetical protein
MNDTVPAIGIRFGIFSGFAFYVLGANVVVAFSIAGAYPGNEVLGIFAPLWFVPSYLLFYYFFRYRRSARIFEAFTSVYVVIFTPLLFGSLHLSRTNWGSDGWGDQIQTCFGSMCWASLIAWIMFAVTRATPQIWAEKRSIAVRLVALYACAANVILVVTIIFLYPQHKFIDSVAMIWLVPSIWLFSLYVLSREEHLFNVLASFYAVVLSGLLFGAMTHMTTSDWGPGGWAQTILSAFNWMVGLSTAAWLVVTLTRATSPLRAADWPIPSSETPADDNSLV